MHFPTFLFLVDKAHELSNILHRIEVDIVKVFARGAVHELVLLASQVFHNAPQHWWHVSLVVVQLEIMDLLCELVEISL